MQILGKFYLSFSGPDLYFFGQVDGVDGWLEKVKIKLNSTQVAVEVEVRVEFGKNVKCACLPNQNCKNVEKGPVNPQSSHGKG